MYTATQQVQGPQPYQRRYGPHIVKLLTQRHKGRQEQGWARSRLASLRLAAGFAWGTLREAREPVQKKGALVACTFSARTHARARAHTQAS